MHQMGKAIIDEVKAAWACGSKFDRVLMVAIWVLFFSYDVIRGNWFDLMVAIIVLVWVWQSVKETALEGFGNG